MVYNSEMPNKKLKYGQKRVKYGLKIVKGVVKIVKYDKKIHVLKYGSNIV